ncbi:MAG: hypothetical protein II921_02435 [Treponema sp.]|nr:hypothetical protein [Treponema sp.]
MTENAIFSYKHGTSFVHKIPAWAKVLFIPLFNIIVFSFGWKVSVSCVLAQIALCFFLRFSPKEQLKDLTPVIFYAVCLYTLNIITQATASLIISKNDISSIPVLLSILKGSFNDRETAGLLVKFTACVQSASILFKTSTSLQLREGIEKIECAVRRFLPCKKEALFAETISSFINFIPAVFKIWNQLCRAWIVRSGKKRLSMYLILLPVLFSECLKYALNASRAITNRKKSA